MSSHAMVATKAGRGGKSASRADAQGRSRVTAALGGEPRVSLLPAEVNDYHRARATRRKLGVAIIMVVLVVAAAVGGSYYLSLSAELGLASARATSDDLLAQQAQFADLRSVENGIALVEAGQEVGASTEIDWTDYLQKLQQTLPAGVQINTVTVDSASPFIDYAQSTVPLQGSRVATLTFGATSPTLPSIPEWLDGLETLVGFSDAIPNSVAINEDNVYTVNITMHINSDAFTKRFQEEQK
ncbi:hypothetical protein BH09ACT5_BH09ACT5_18660 [soil metagenome]